MYIHKQPFLIYLTIFWEMLNFDDSYVDVLSKKISNIFGDILSVQKKGSIWCPIVFFWSSFQSHFFPWGIHQYHQLAWSMFYMKHTIVSESSFLSRSWKLLAWPKLLDKYKAGLCSEGSLSTEVDRADDFEHLLIYNLEISILHKYHWKDNKINIPWTC